MLKAVKYELSEVPQSYWDFVCEYGNLYHSKPYLEFYTASGNKSFVVGVYEDGELVGGTGITIMREILDFPIKITTYFGPVVKDAQRVVDVLLCIAEAIKRMSLFFSIVVLPEYAGILSEDVRLSSWNKQEIEFLYWDISAPLETFWRKLQKGKKAAINRARRECVIIQEIETIEHVKQFQRVYEMSQIRGGRTPTLQIYFENMIKIMKPEGLATGFLALHPETRQPIAGVMLHLGWNGIARYYSVGHDYEYRNLGSTDFLMWHCLQFLKSKGFTVFDLMGLPQGDSGRARGIRHFKTSWAGNNGYIQKTYTISYGSFGLNPRLLKNVVNGFKKTMALFRKKHDE